ncbi:uncharacterized protein FIBRA_07614 [Fibroporia radiculosa]|uniref:Uncharacterized protein n=1 Tax=Fibroporia radiculosa TaxID=599839 RepID=J4GF43_9APHY|nr:uncharacterized protein FIBRA_07614 [Fibroporia radiculosa]CCM05398.1 predicted protein [Fibroporia radiculosa]
METGDVPPSAAPLLDDPSPVLEIQHTRTPSFHAHPARAGTYPVYLQERGISSRRPTERAQTLPDPLPSASTVVEKLDGFTFLTPKLSDSDLPTPSGDSKHDGNDAVERKRNPFVVAWRWSFDQITNHWIIFSTFFILSTVAICFAVGFSLRLKFFDAVQVLDQEEAQQVPAVVLGANLITIDAIGQTMTLDWFVYYNCNPSDCVDVNVYFDQNLLRTGSQSGAANNEKPTPIFFINGTDYLTYNAGSNSDWRTNSPEFRTQVAITNYYAGGRSAQSYPFDKYTALLVFFAEDTNNNTIPMALNVTTGIAVGYNAALETYASGTGLHGELIKEFTVTRGQVVRLYAILTVIAVWLVTLTFVMACITTVFFGKGVQPDILVAPVAALFAFTALRSTLPGAPTTFGADIDFVGILPCLALLIFSSVFMSAIFLFRREPENDTRRWVEMHKKV